jgi:hypothetical protein
MVSLSEPNAEASDGKLPWWAFPLAAVALVLVPPDRAEREKSDPAVFGRRDRRGRTASTPSDIPLKGWKDIFWRVYHNIPKHRVIAIAAGVTFYALLAIFPGVAARPDR